MEISDIVKQLLENIKQPAFLSMDNKVVYANCVANKLHILPNSSVPNMISSPIPTEDNIDKMQLTFSIDGIRYLTTKQKVDDFELFILDSEETYSPFHALGIVSSQLRIPLTKLMIALEASNTKEAVRATHQMHRVISNMSDSMRYRTNYKPILRLVDIDQFIASIVEKIAAQQENLPFKITYTGPSQTIHSAIDKELIERALMNIICNCAGRKSKSIHIALTKHNNEFILSVKEDDTNISKPVCSQIYAHYICKPGLENIPYDFNLNQEIIHLAATAHKGTVYTSTENNENQITVLTLPIIQENLSLRSPIIEIDYLGGRDHVLTELSEFLSSAAY